MGPVRRVPMQKQFVCVGCKGSGSTKVGGGKTCNACNGQGMRMEMRQMGPFVTQQPVECRKCNGEGVMINPGDECKSCNGRRVMQRQHMLEIPIERGLASGDKVVLRGESNQVPGQEPGDIVIFVVEQTPEDFPFKRVNKDDLIFRQKITLTEALVGFKFALKHMDDRTLVITSQAGDVIKPGAKKVVLGEGMPIKGMPSERGRLIIEFDVEFPGPEFVTEAVRQALEKILPKTPEFVLPAGAADNFAEHVAVDYVAREEEYTRPEAYDSDGESGHSHGTRTAWMRPTVIKKKKWRKKQVKKARTKEKRKKKKKMEWNGWFAAAAASVNNVINTAATRIEEATKPDSSAKDEPRPSSSFRCAHAHTVGR